MTESGRTNILTNDGISYLLSFLNHRFLIIVHNFRHFHVEKSRIKFSHCLKQKFTFFRHTHCPIQKTVLHLLQLGIMSGLSGIRPQSVLSGRTENFLSPVTLIINNSTGTSQVGAKCKAQNPQNVFEIRSGRYGRNSGQNSQKKSETPKMSLSCSVNASEVRIYRSGTNGSACFEPPPPPWKTQYSSVQRQQFGYSGLLRIFG